LEKSLATSFQESVSLDSNLSTEHIWLQNQGQDTSPSVATKKDGSTDWIALVHRQSLINSMGISLL
jgi:hypothetical protein